MAEMEFDRGSGDRSGAVANVAPQASTPVAITAADKGKTYTNEGTSSSITFTLPTAAVNLQYSFYVQDSDGLSIVANTGDTLRIAGSVTPTAGNLSSTTVGSWITVTAINATEWVASVVTGGWVVSV